MALSEEEADKIKERLLKQLSNFPEDKRGQIEGQVNSMTTEDVEEFIEKNNLAHLGGNCIFCSIVAGNNPSIKILENDENIAVLEINPLSKGHTLIVPKDHLDSVPPSAKMFAQRVGKLLLEKLRPKEIKVNELNIMGHALIEVIPIYGGETERSPATESELKEVYNILTKKEEIEKVDEIEDEEDEKALVENLPILPPRIPN